MTDQRKRWGGLTRSNSVATPQKSVSKVGRFASLRRAFSKSGRGESTRPQNHDPSFWANPDLVAAPLRLRNERIESFSSIQQGVEVLDVLKSKPRVRFDDNLRIEGRTLSPSERYPAERYQTRPLPPIPPRSLQRPQAQPQAQAQPLQSNLKQKQKQKQKQTSFTVSHFQSDSDPLPEEEWGKAVEESYERGEFAEDVEVAETWLEGVWGEEIGEERLRAYAEFKRNLYKPEPIPSILDRPRPIPRYPSQRGEPSQRGVYVREQTEEEKEIKRLIGEKI